MKIYFWQSMSVPNVLDIALTSVSMCLIIVIFTIIDSAKKGRKELNPANKEGRSIFEQFF